MSRTRKPLVALLMMAHKENMRGIGKYAWPDRPWIFQFSNPSEKALRQLRQDPPDGVLAYLSEPELEHMARELTCPVVNISSALRDVGTARVTCDNIKAGQMAADYFFDRAFRHFAYVGDGKTAYSEDRFRGFRERVTARGYTCTHFASPYSAYPTAIENVDGDEALCAWLGGLPQETAIFAVNDWVGWRLTEAAAQLEISVPDELAILGMDNMGVSLLSPTRLSSLPYPSERVAYEAAALLDRLMHGEDCPTEVRIAPEGVVTRHSTDVLAVSDPHLAKAVLFIRTHYSEPIKVPDVARASGLNRRTLEKRFAAILGRTPGDEIRRVRVEKARELLVNTGESIDEIAYLCGFSGRRWMSSVFCDVTGMTPARYRVNRAIADR